jgi:hypothetical protein
MGDEKMVIDVCKDCSIRKNSCMGFGDDSFCFSCANGTIYSGCECGNNHIIDDDNRNSFTIDLIEKNDSIIEVINCK